MRNSRLILGVGLAALITGCGGSKEAPAASESAPEATTAETATAEVKAEVNPSIWPKAESPIARDAAIEAEVARLLSTMTLEQKVGQIIQPDIASITPEEAGQYHVGSVLNGGNSAPGGDLRADPAEWVKLADEFWDASVGPDGTGIPLLWGTDAVHGHSNIVGATIFPHNIGLGAANDPSLMRQIGEITATEIVVTGLDWTFAPTLATPRDDRWGRAYEGYSEDPRIVAAYSGELVLGLQGVPGTDSFLAADKVLATAKHFVGDGGTFEGIDQGKTIATEEEMRDIHAAGYVPALEAGVQSVMASFSSWNDKKMHGYKLMLTDVLVDRMGLDGFVVGDWNGHGQVKGCTATNCPASIEAGVDMFMAPDSWRDLYTNTIQNVKDGDLSMERLDQAVSRILRVKLRMGLMDRGTPSSRPLAGKFELLAAPEHRAVARDAVRKSLVMLKNDGVLPIRGNANVLLAGDGADNLGKQTGGWTLSWQGDGNSREDFPNGETIFEGFQAALSASGGSATLSVDGTYSEKPDVAVVVFGEDPYAEFRGDLPNVDFGPTEPLAILERLQSEGVPVVAVFLSGRPMWMNPELNASDAFVAAWLPGSEGGGVADVLVADAEGTPRHDVAGRLSFSWPKRPDQARLNVGDENYDPLFAYGHGLSYGDDGAVDTLPVDYDTGTVDQTIIVADGKAGGNRLLVIDSANSSVLVQDAIAQTVNGALALSRVDRNAQEDSIQLTWNGSAPASMRIQQKMADIRRESNADIGITIEYRTDDQNGAEVQFGVGRGLYTLPTTAPGEFASVSARLECFADRGADLSQVSDAFVLESDGPATLTVSSVRMTPSEGGAPCPQ